MPDHPEVERIAEKSSFPDRIELPDLDYEKDLEDFKSVETYLSEGVGDCEDHAILSGSVLEHEGIPWRMVFEYGHTEVEFLYDGEVYLSSVGSPKEPWMRDSGDSSDLMFDLDNGLQMYDRDWYQG